MGEVGFLVEELLDGVGDGGGLDVAVGLDHAGGVALVVGEGEWGVGFDDGGEGEEGEGKGGEEGAGA